MSEQPFYLSRAGRPPPREAPGGLFWIVLAAAAAVAVVARLLWPVRVRLMDNGLAIELGGVVGSGLLVAAVATAILYFVSGRTRGGTKDFLLIWGAAGLAPILGSFFLTGLAGLSVAGDKETAKPIWDAYVAEARAAHDELNQKMKTLAPAELIEALRGSHDFKAYEAGSAEGRAALSAAQDRIKAAEKTARAAFKALGPSRKALLRQFDKEVDLRRPADDQLWTLWAEAYGKADAMVAILRRSPGRWRGRMYEFTRDGDLETLNTAMDDFNAGVAALNKQAAAVNDWEARRSQESQP